MLAPVLKNGSGDLVAVVRQAQDLRQLLNDARSDGLWRVMRGKTNDRAYDLFFFLLIVAMQWTLPADNVFIPKSECGIFLFRTLFAIPSMV